MIYDGGSALEIFAVRFGQPITSHSAPPHPTDIFLSPCRPCMSCSRRETMVWTRGGHEKNITLYPKLLVPSYNNTIYTLYTHTHTYIYILYVCNMYMPFIYYISSYYCKTILIVVSSTYVHTAEAVYRPYVLIKT